MIEIEFVWGRDLERRTKVATWPAIPRKGELVDVGVEYPLLVRGVTYAKNGNVQILLEY